MVNSKGVMVNLEVFKPDLSCWERQRGWPDHGRIRGSRKVGQYRISDRLGLIAQEEKGGQGSHCTTGQQSIPGTGQEPFCMEREGLAGKPTECTEGHEGEAKEKSMEFPRWGNPRCEDKTRSRDDKKYGCEHMQEPSDSTEG